LRAFTLILFIAINLFGADTLSIAKIYDSIFTKISQSNSVRVYCDSQEYKEILFRSRHISLIDSPDDADIILQTKFNSNYSSDKIIFTPKYSLLKRDKNIIGAFYWSKGRPQIVFIRKRLNKKRVNLVNDLQKYIIESL